MDRETKRYLKIYLSLTLLLSWLGWLLGGLISILITNSPWVGSFMLGGTFMFAGLLSTAIGVYKGEQYGRNN